MLSRDCTTLSQAIRILTPMTEQMLYFYSSFNRFFVGKICTISAVKPRK